MFFSKPKSHLGIDIGAGGIKLVEFKVEKNRPVLFTYGMVKSQKKKLNLKEDKTVEELVGDKKEKKDELMDVEYLSSLIKSAIKASRVVSRSAMASLPSYSVFSALVTLPLVAKDEFDHSLKAEVKKFIARPIEEMALDFQVLYKDESKKIQRVVVNAVPFEIISTYSKIFQKAGIELTSLEPESMALSRSLIGKDPAVSMIVDIGQERTNLFMVDKMTPVTSKSIEIGGRKIDEGIKNITGLEENEISQVKYDLYKNYLNARGSGPNFLSSFSTLLDPIFKEIEYSIDLFTKQEGNENKKPEKIVLTGGSSTIPFLTKEIENKFQIKCYVGDPWARVVYQDSLRPVLLDIGPKMGVSIGLALRNVL